MFSQLKKIIAILSATALLSMGAKIAIAQEHQHSHGAVESPQLTLNNGKKWETDESLRQGMNRIRDSLAAELPAIHAGKATAEQYKALAKKTNEQLAFILNNCKLDQKTDAMLHNVLADIIDGTEVMSGNNINNARKAAEKIAEALDNYGTYFAHPGWHGVKEDH